MRAKGNSMRFIHTADWHLGRVFHGVHLTEDQAVALERLVEIVKETRPDAIVVAGDIYDRAVPPPDAVELLDDVLSRLVLDLKIPTILIAGNHDSPGRLAFGSRLLGEQKLHVAGPMKAVCRPVEIADAHGTVAFYPLPYAEPAAVRACLGGDGTVIDHESAMRALVRGIESAARGEAGGERSRRDGSAGRRVIVGHAFVAGGSSCESERPLTVGAAGTVPADAFAGFNYTALGHLHSAQSLAGGTVRYSGSILKYSFDEAGHRKGINLVEMDARGACTVEQIALPPRRDVRRISGFFSELLKGPTAGESKEDYVQATILDAGPILDAMPRLRESWPNILHVERPNRIAGGAAPGSRPNARQTNEVDLFAHFFEHVTGEAMSAGQMEEFEGVVNRMNLGGREEAAITSRNGE
jgi:exonuclease SbcD